MQSYLQSRRIGLAVQAQVERDRDRAALITGSSCAAGAGAEADGHHLPTTVLDPAVLPRKTADAQAGGSPVDGHAEEHGVGLDRQTSSSSSVSSASSSNVAERIPTVATQYTARAALGHSLTGIHARDRRTHEGKGRKVFVVGWEGPDDPLSPRNWSIASRVSCTLIISLIAGTVGCASGIDATMLPQAADDLGVSEVAESLATGECPANAVS
jgi:hypothetical protein